MNVGNLISGSSASSKPVLYICKFSVQIPLQPNLEDSDHNLASMMSFFEIGMKTDLFYSCGPIEFYKFVDIMNVSL